MNLEVLESKLNLGSILSEILLNPEVKCSVNHIKTKLSWALFNVYNRLIISY